VLLEGNSLGRRLLTEKIPNKTRRYIHKSQFKNTNQMKKQCNMIAVKLHNSPISGFKDTEIVKIPDEVFRSLVLKLITSKRI
jgi:hypothetical protein